MKILTVLFILSIGQLTHGQSIGQFRSNPENASSMILKLKKNHTFKFLVKKHIAETIKQTGKWKIEMDTVILSDIRQPIYRIGLFEMPIKWTFLKEEVCGVPKSEWDYHECLKREW